MFKYSASDALDALEQASVTYRRLLEEAEFDIGIYRPRSTDAQTPHARDEIYVVATGSGDFLCGGETRPITAGDVLFAARGVEHRFANFSDDFSTWVVFIGRHT